mgnify:CR=1 FL=1
MYGEGGAPWCTHVGHAYLAARLAQAASHTTEMAVAEATAAVEASAVQQQRPLGLFDGEIDIFLSIVTLPFSIIFFKLERVKPSILSER